MSVIPDDDNLAELDALFGYTPKIKKSPAPDDKIARERAAIEVGAQELGIDPVDYATAISYESAGTFDPWVKGPVTKWGQHRGTIQYGEPQRRQYGVYEGQPFEEQVTKSNVKYLRDAGVKPGASFEQIYAAINGGSAKKDLSTPDWNTGRTISDNIRKAMSEHRPKVLQRYGWTEAQKAAIADNSDLADLDKLFGYTAPTNGGSSAPSDLTELDSLFGYNGGEKPLRPGQPLGQDTQLPPTNPTGVALRTGVPVQPQGVAEQPISIPREYTKRDLTKLREGETYYDFEKTGKAGDGLNYLGVFDNKHYAKDVDDDEYELQPGKDGAGWKPVNQFPKRLKFGEAEYSRKRDGVYVDKDGEEFEVVKTADGFSRGKHVNPLQKELTFEGGKKLTRKENDIYTDESGDEHRVTATPGDQGYSYSTKPVSPFTKEIKLKDGKTLIRQDDDKPGAKTRRYIDSETGKDYQFDGKQITARIGGKTTVVPPKVQTATPVQKSPIDSSQAYETPPTTEFSDPVVREAYASNQKRYAFKDTEEMRQRFLRGVEQVKAGTRQQALDDGEMSEFGNPDAVSDVIRYSGGMPEKSSALEWMKSDVASYMESQYAVPFTVTKDFLDKQGIRDLETNVNYTEQEARDVLRNKDQYPFKLTNADKRQLIAQGEIHKQNSAIYEKGQKEGLAPSSIIPRLADVTDEAGNPIYSSEELTAMADAAKAEEDAFREELVAKERQKNLLHISGGAVAYPEGKRFASLDTVATSGALDQDAEKAIKRAAEEQFWKIVRSPGGIAGHKMQEAQAQVVLAENKDFRDKMVKAGVPQYTVPLQIVSNIGQGTMQVVTDVLAATDVAKWFAGVPTWGDIGRFFNERLDHVLAGRPLTAGESGYLPSVTPADERPLFQASQAAQKWWKKNSYDDPLFHTDPTASVILNEFPKLLPQLIMQAGAAAATGGAALPTILGASQGLMERYKEAKENGASDTELRLIVLASAGLAVPEFFANKIILSPLLKKASGLGTFAEKTSVELFREFTQVASNAEAKELTRVAMQGIMGRLWQAAKKSGSTSFKAAVTEAVQETWLESKINNAIAYATHDKTQTRWNQVQFLTKDDVVEMGVSALGGGAMGLGAQLAASRSNLGSKTIDIDGQTYDVPPAFRGAVDQALKQYDRSLELAAQSKQLFEASRKQKTQEARRQYRDAARKAFTKANAEFAVAEEMYRNVQRAISGGQSLTKQGNERELDTPLRAVQAEEVLNRNEFRNTKSGQRNPLYFNQLREDIKNKNWSRLVADLTVTNPNTVEFFKKETGVDLGTTSRTIQEGLAAWGGKELTQWQQQKEVEASRTLKVTLPSTEDTLEPESKPNEEIPQSAAPMDETPLVQDQPTDEQITAQVADVAKADDQEDPEWKQFVAEMEASASAQIAAVTEDPGFASFAADNPAAAQSMMAGVKPATTATKPPSAEEGLKSVARLWRGHSGTSLTDELKAREGMKPGQPQFRTGPFVYLAPTEGGALQYGFRAGESGAIDRVLLDPQNTLEHSAKNLVEIENAIKPTVSEKEWRAYQEESMDAKFMHSQYEWLGHFFPDQVKAWLDGQGYDSIRLGGNIAIWNTKPLLRVEGTTPVRDETGRKLKVTRPDDIEKGVIPEEPWQVFEKAVADNVNGKFQMAKISDLIPTQDLDKEHERNSWQSGTKHHPVARAFNHINDARLGGKARRNPILVRRGGKGKFKIVDGHATVGALERAGWSEVPIIVIPEPIVLSVEVNDHIRQLSLSALKYAQSEAKGYLEDVRAVAAQVGGVVPKIAEEFAVKTESSLLRKLNLKPNKVPTDLLRTMILLPAGSQESTRGRIAAAIDAMGKQGYRVVVDEKNQVDVTDRFDSTDPGYKDFAIKFEKGNTDPLVRELLFLQPAMYKAKEGLGVDFATGESKQVLTRPYHTKYDSIKDLNERFDNTPGGLSNAEAKRALVEIRRLAVVMIGAYAKAYALDSASAAPDILSIALPILKDSSSSSTVTGDESSRDLTMMTAEGISDVVQRNRSKTSLSSTDRVERYLSASDKVVTSNSNSIVPQKADKDTGLKKARPPAGSALTVFDQPKPSTRSAATAVENIEAAMTGAMETPVREATPGEIEEAFYRNALVDLNNWVKEHLPNYTSFYGADVAKANAMLQDWAKEQYGRNLKPEEVELFHLLGSLAASGLQPREDSAYAVIMLDDYLRTGRISAFDPMSFRPKFVAGKDTGDVRFTEDPETGKSVVDTGRYSTKVHPEPYEALSRILGHFKGDLKQAMDWIKTGHPLQELLDVSGQPKLGTHEYLNPEDGGEGVFSLFISSGAKLGSYHLARVGDLSKVVKDVWYGRSEARYLGMPLTTTDKDGKTSAIGGPLEPSTKYGLRARIAEDNAISRLAKKFKVEPGVIQQWLWDAEQKLWEHAGMPGSKPSYISEGVKDGIERLGQRTSAPERSVATMGVGVVREGTGSSIEATAERFTEEQYKKALEIWNGIIKAFNVHTSGPGNRFTTLKLHNTQQTVGIWEGTSSSMEESALWTVSGPTQLVRGFAVASAIMAPNVQQAVMLNTYNRNGTGTETHITFKDRDAVNDFVANRDKYGAGNMSLNPATETVILVDNKEYPVDHEGIGKDYGGQTTNIEHRPVNTEFIDESEYQRHLQETRAFVARFPGKRRESINRVLDEAEARLEQPLKSVSRAARTDPQRERSGDASDGRAAEAAAVIRTGERAVPAEQRHKFGQDFALTAAFNKEINRQEAALEAFARQEGIWFEPDAFAKSPDSAGSEALVYIDKPATTVTKLVNPRASAIAPYGTPEQFINDRIFSYNTIFPESAYTLKGFMRDREGVFRFVVEQPLAIGEPPTSHAPIQQMMAGKGFKVDTFQGDYTNGTYRIMDAGPQNAIVTEDGTVIVIDAIPRMVEQVAVVTEALPQKAELPGSLGIKRADMPQIRQEDQAEFIQFAADRGVVIVPARVRAADLKPTQNEYNPNNAAGIPIEKVLGKSLMASADNRVLDGHNTLVRLQEDPDRMVNILRIPLPAKRALKLMHDFPKTTKKSVAQVGATEEPMKKAGGETHKSVPVVDENEDSIVKRTRTPEAARELHETLPAEDLANILGRVTGGTLHANGELELSPHDSEILRRLMAHRNDGRHETAFEGIVWSSRYMRVLAEFGRTVAREIMVKEGFTDESLKGFDTLMNNLDLTADANEGYAVAYVFDDALPHERTHKEDLEAGRTSEAALEELKAHPLWNTEGTNFDTAYPGISDQDKASELAAILRNDEGAEYGLDTNQAKTNEFLETWARGIITNNASQIARQGFDAWARRFPRISAIAFEGWKRRRQTQQGAANAKTDTHIEEKGSSGETPGEVGAGPAQSVREDAAGGAEEVRSAEVGRRADQLDRQQETRGGVGLTADDAQVAAATGWTVSEVEAHNRRFARSLAENLFDIGDVEYDPQTVKGWRDGAEDTLLELGVDTAMDEYRRMPAGASEGRKTALGVAIATELYAQGRTADLTTFGKELTENIGNAAQELRAAALISRLEPAFAQVTGDKITNKAHGRGMTEAEREKTDELAKQLQEAADAHAFTRAALEEARETAARLADHATDLENMLAAESSRGRGKNEAELQTALDEALAQVEKYKKMAEAKPPKVRGPKALKDLRKNIEAERADLVAAIRAQFPGSGLKSSKPPALAAFLKGSVVQEPQYHMTTGDFSVFETRRLGIHLGTVHAASDLSRHRGVKKSALTVKEPLHRAEARQEDGEWGVWDARKDDWHPALVHSEKEAAQVAKWLNRQTATHKALPGANIMPVWVSIKNPVTIPDPVADDPMHLANFLYGEGKISYDDTIRVQTATRKRGTGLPQKEQGNVELRRILMEKGYDGARYKNRYEDPGSTSYVAFAPNQIKSAIGNNGNWDPDEDSILKKAVPTSMPWQEFGRHLETLPLRDAFGKMEASEKRQLAAAAERWELVNVHPQTLNRTDVEAKDEMPIIVDPEGDVLDGRHRRAEAIANGTRSIKAWVGTDEDSPLKMTAWHGSPHKFDRFSVSKIGTGEGAQTFGYGLYFTDTESYAQHYKDKLTKGHEISYDGTIAYNSLTRQSVFGEDKTPHERAIEYVGQSIANSDARNDIPTEKFINSIVWSIEQRITRSLDYAQNNELSDGMKAQYEQDVATLEAVRSLDPAKFKAEKNTGAKYRVDLKPAEDEYLLWDKPLNEQSEKVQQALAYLGESGHSTTKGETIYRDLAKSSGSQVGASNHLKFLGVRGIKYLDGLSRSKGEGAYNYVVFDDADVEIEEVFLFKKINPSNLSIPQPTFDALVKVSAAKLIDELPKGLTMKDFDKWLKVATNGQLTPFDTAAVHAEAYQMSKVAGKPMSNETRVRLRNRLEHAARAEEILGTREARAQEREAARREAKGKVKAGEAYRDDKFAQRMLEVAESIAADDIAVLMAFGLRETPDARKLKQTYEQANGSPGGFSAAINAGHQLRDLTKTTIDDERVKAALGANATEKDVADMDRGIKELATEERLKRRALQQQFERLGQSTGRKIGNVLLSIYNVPRSIMFSGDLGFMFAQGMPTLLMHPTAWWKAMSTGVPAAMRTKSFENLVTELYEAEARRRLEGGGVKFEQIGNVADFNEDFMSDIARHIPVVKQTNLAHSLTTDLFRLYGGTADLAELDAMYEAGKLTPTEYNRSKEFLLKKWVNVMSGKGYLGMFSPFAMPAAQVASAPRYTVSAFQIPYYANPLRAAFLPKGARKIMMKNSAKLWVPISMLMVLLSSLGLINDDPEDKDFLQIDMGKLIGVSDMKLNIIRALKEPIRVSMGLPLKMAYYKATGNQEGVDRIKKQYYAQFITSPFGGVPSFWASKAHPTISMIGQIYTGKNFVGDPVGLDDVLPIPLGFKETYQAAGYNRKESILKTGRRSGSLTDNWGRVAASFIGNFIGFGANSFPGSDTTTAVKQLQSMMEKDTRPQAEKDQSAKANQLERLIREGVDVSEDIMALLNSGGITAKQAERLKATIADDLGDVEKRFGIKFSEEETVALMNNRRALKVLDYLYTERKIDWKKIDAGLRFATPEHNRLNGRAALAQAEAVVLQAVLRSGSLTGQGVSTNDIVEMYKAREGTLSESEKGALQQVLRKKAANANKGGTLTAEELEQIKTVIPDFNIVLKSPKPKK